MADLPEPVEDALHVAVGAAVLGVNWLQVRRRRLEKLLAELQVADQIEPPRRAGAVRQNVASP
jgi:hypothetical protein